MAAGTVIVQARTLVGLGEIDPGDDRHPGHLRRPRGRGAGADERTRGDPSGRPLPVTQGLTRNQVAWRIARDIPEGAFVNLGIGQPVLVANFVPAEREVIFHSENGILGMGPEPPDGLAGRGPDQRRQAADNPGARRIAVPSRGLVCDGARRASRPLRPRRVPGRGQRRPRELVDRRAGRDPRRRRRDGPRGRRQGGVCDDRSLHEARGAQDRRTRELSADRPRRRQPDLHRPRGDRGDAGGARRAARWWRASTSPSWPRVPGRRSNRRTGSALLGAPAL